MDKNKIVVFLDPGHTSKTPGKCSPDKRLREYAYVREIISMIEKELDKLGIKHWNTHPEEGWISSSYATDSKDLVQRANRVNKKYAELKKEGKTAILISVHCNAAGNGQWMNARGWSAWTTKGQNNSDKLATELYKAAHEILDPMKMKIRTDKQDGDEDWESNFYILKQSNCICTLVEMFFQDNKEDVEFLLSNKGKKTNTDIIVKGILNYINKY